MRRFLFVLLVVVVLLATAEPVASSEADDMVALVRLARGDTLPVSPLLTTNAQKRAISISIEYSHSGAGVPGITWGEVIAKNTYPLDLSAQAAIDGWDTSAAHNPVFYGDWDAFGVGYVYIDGVHYWVLVFGRWPAPMSRPAVKAGAPAPHAKPFVIPTPPVTSTE